MNPETVDVEPAVGYLDAPPPDADTQPPPDERPTNIDDSGVAHFCVIPPGNSVDVCGGCGNAWPCAGAVHLLMIELPPED